MSRLEVENPNFVELTIKVHRPRGAYNTATKIANEIEDHLTIRLDPEYDSDLEVTIDAVA